MTSTRELLVMLRGLLAMRSHPNARQQLACLKTIAVRPPRNARDLRVFHDLLLFMVAFPINEELLATAAAALRGLPAALASVHLRAARLALENSGIAGTALNGGFSLALTRWLLAEFPGNVSLAQVGGSLDAVRQTLIPALDPFEQEVLSEHTPGWASFCDEYLGGSDRHRLSRLAGAYAALPASAACQEALFAFAQIHLRWELAADAPVLTAGRAPCATPYYHQRKLRHRVPLRAAWRGGPVRRVKLTAALQRQLLTIARATLCAAFRETDFLTYADPRATEFYDLGRGLRVALFVMQPARRLALEAYVGYMVFKNGVPLAYGGGWLLGIQARFGINVFPAFRGGESALILGRLLYLYSRRFGARLFAVEPYQLGRGNADGIRSATFWFYYRLGFRPLEPELNRLAAAEYRKLRASGAHTPRRVLRQLAQSTMVWGPRSARYIEVRALSTCVGRWIEQRNTGNRAQAQADALADAGFHHQRRAPSLQRLAVLLAACRPPGGWKGPARNAWFSFAHLKARDEMASVRVLQRQPQVLAALRSAAQRGLEST